MKENLYCFTDLASHWALQLKITQPLVSFMLKITLNETREVVIVGDIGSVAIIQIYRKR